MGPSPIALSTVQLPQDGSTLHFLRGVGVPDAWITLYQAEMIHPTQYYSLFISYSSKDENLARRLYADLQAQGVRCWFAPEAMKIGHKIRDSIEEAIHQQDKLLLLLSEQSIASTWVGNEVETALEKEDRVFSALTFTATTLSSATQKTLPAFVGRSKMLIKKVYQPLDHCICW